MLKCEVIRDLLSLYIDDCCSGESRRLVEEHLKNCGECRKLFEAMTQTVEIPEEEREKNLLEEEYLKAGKKAVKTEVKNEYFSRATVLDLFMNTVIFGAILFISFNGNLNLRLREVTSWLKGYHFFVGGLALAGAYGDIAFAVQKKMRKLVTAKYAVIVSLAWKLTIFWCFFTFASVILLYKGW